MSWTLVGHGMDGHFSGTPSSVAISGVNAGDSVFLAAYSADATSTFTVGDGSSTFTGLTTLTASTNWAKMRGYYCLSSVASGTVTYTLSCSPDATHDLFVWVVRPSGAASFDVQSVLDDSTTTSADSGTTTTTGSDEVAFGALIGESFTGTPSAMAIGGVSALASDTDFFGGTAWYTTHAAPFTGGATATVSSQRVLCILATFKSTGSNLLVMQRTVLDYID